ncbi:MarR family winged helix-turn-helix transcriptional regulator [Amycolatopsis sp. NPDC059021]|uniref:MarR family winged helix-turn-helix transcriptional regulator n=1 Tax=Amycolatopsis sp. NPDC059021 TaxID=3346704 RepID=UPI00366FBAB4
MADAEGRTYPIAEHEVRRFVGMSHESSTLTVLRHAKIAARMGLSSTDHRSLDLIGQAGEPLSAGRIAELTGLSTGTITGVVDRLEKAGLVSRIRDPVDRRRVLVTVVADAADRYAPFVQETTDLVRAVIAQFSPEERRAIERFQQLMLKSLHTEITNRRH